MLYVFFVLLINPHCYILRIATDVLELRLIPLLMLVAPHARLRTLVAAAL